MATGKRGKEKGDVGVFVQVGPVRLGQGKYSWVVLTPTRVKKTKKSSTSPETDDAEETESDGTGQRQAYSATLGGALTFVLDADIDKRSTDARTLKELIQAVKEAHQDVLELGRELRHRDPWLEQRASEKAKHAELGLRRRGVRLPRKKKKVVDE